MTAIGFTGTRYGMTQPQLQALRNMLTLAKDTGVEMLHHGMCVGADDQANTAAHMLGLLTHGHPAKGVRQIHVARCRVDVQSPPLPPLRRNRAIVAACTELLAAPAGDITDPEPVRSGTWTTVRYARQANKRVWLVWPSGQVTE